MQREEVARGNLLGAQGLVRGGAELAAKWKLLPRMQWGPGQQGRAWPCLGKEGSESGSLEPSARVYQDRLFRGQLGAWARAGLQSHLSVEPSLSFLPIGCS